MNTIMIIDDDPYIRELVRTLLKDEGYATQEAVDGCDALKKLGETKVDLCVLDIMMPNMDGFEFCAHARRYYMDMPILMLTAKNEIGQKVKGFELGVDDYLVKPFENAELVARVGALLKRYKIASSQMLKIGALIMDRNSYAVTTDGKKADIPMKEFELLFKLAGFPGRTFPRDQLIEDVWGFDFDGNERTLDVHIGRLRDRFPAEQFHFKIITIRGLGYRLEVEE
ncbi:response regulator transcription factor [Clostridium akagii]|uniref:response regulator transcription factor n=1 Tax=Clostridium akagii TaxID=91623 RepID=UPI00047CCBBD|nr:response regulator transcription factor [Clostridium akagii]